MKINNIIQSVLVLISITILILVINLIKIENYNHNKLIELENKMNSNMTRVEERFTIIDNENIEIKENINGIVSVNMHQFNEAKKVRMTYDKLLDEQKKKTVDVSGKDSLVIELTEIGNKQYSEGKYLDAYENYCKVLLYQPENSEIRFKKMSSLYYSNSMNSTNQKEILDDCSTLKNNGYTNPKIEEIEKSVRQERDGIINE